MNWVRRAVYFLLGAVLLVDVIVGQFSAVELAVALILLNLVPLDMLAERWNSHCAHYPEPCPPAESEGGDAD